MNSNLKLVEQLDDNTIYNQIKPIVTSTLKKFKYVDISSDEYKIIITELINELRTAYDGSVHYLLFIKDRLELFFKNKTKTLITNSKTSFKIVNNYINQKFNNVSNYYSSIKCFKELNDLFQINEFLPSRNFLIELIENNAIFNKMIEFILLKYNNASTQTEIVNNELLLLTMDTYCNLKNISLDRTYTLEKESYSLSDEDALDSETMYLKEISKIPLLTALEEKNLSSRIAKGDNEARDLFIKSNLRLVASIARQYKGKGLPFLDLVQEGNIGLMKAIEGFDPEKGYRFSTYAYSRINQVICRAIAEKSRNIRIPVYIYEKVIECKKTIYDLQNELHRLPTVLEMANKMRITISFAEKLYKLQNDVFSIDDSIDEERNLKLKDIIVSEETTEEVVLQNDLISEIKKLFKDCKLQEREIQILLLRNGVITGKEETLKDVAKIYNISSQRVSQLEIRALKKIRNSNYVKNLSFYMGDREKAIQNINAFREIYKTKKKGQSKNLDTQLYSDVSIQRLPKTIYEYFRDYTKEQVDEILLRLDEKDKELINKLLKNEIKKEEEYKIYKIIMPKISSMLSDTFESVKFVLYK